MLRRFSKESAKRLFWKNRDGKLSERRDLQLQLNQLASSKKVFISKKSQNHFSEYLNEKFIFYRPLTVTGAKLYKNESELVFHQMTLDRIENGEYIIQNTQFKSDSEAGMV